MLIFTFTADRPEKRKLAIFLAINHKRNPGTLIWYCNSPLGKNAIGKFLVNAAKAAGPSENIINHSVRKTCISRLMVLMISQRIMQPNSVVKKALKIYTYTSQPRKAISDEYQWLLVGPTLPTLQATRRFKLPKRPNSKCQFKGKKHQV